MQCHLDRRESSLQQVKKGLRLMRGGATFGLTACGGFEMTLKNQLRHSLFAGMTILSNLRLFTTLAYIITYNFVSQ